MRRKKSLAARQAKKNAKNAHNLDAEVKGLHKLVKKSKKSAEKFHQDVRESQQKLEMARIPEEKSSRLTESALQKSAEEQMAELALIGHRIKKSA